MVRKKIVHIALITLVVVLLYLNTLPNEFIWDDVHFITGEPATQHFDWKFILTNPQIGSYRPIRTFFLTVSYELFGDKPTGYHVQAIFLHALICVLVYLIAGIITRNSSAALAVGLLFAVYPVHTQPIDLASASFILFGVLFFFCSLYLFLLYRTKGRLWMLSLSFLVFLLAVFTYEWTVVLPLIIVGYDYLLGKRQMRWAQYAAYFLIASLSASVSCRADSHTQR